MNTFTSLQNFWDKKLIPIFNGIFFQNGVVKALELSSDGQIRSGGTSNLDAVTEIAPQLLSSIDVKGTLKIDASHQYCFGGGSFGGDAFIAYLDRDIVEWIIFLDWYSDLNFCQLREDGSLVFFQDSYSRDALALISPSPETVKLVSLGAKSY